MRQKFNWDDLKLFLALVRFGTVRRAGKNLGISHSTIARRVDGLEQRLDVRLFERLPSGYAVTPAGEEMLAVAEDVENQMAGLERRLSGQNSELNGVIRLTMVDFLSTHLIMPHLAAFSCKYPDIDLQVEATYNIKSLEYREADVALRFGATPDEDLFGRRLLNVATAVYVSKELLFEKTTEPIRDTCWIGFGENRPSINWVQKSPFPNLPVRGSFTSLLVQLAACKSSMGLAILPCFIGDPEPELQRLTEPEKKSNFDLWLLTHGDVRKTARFRALTDFLSAAIKKQQSLLEGMAVSEKSQ